MTSLSILIDKAPIVSTYASQALQSHPALVRETYQWHADTYVEQSVLAQLRRLFIERVQEAKTAKACIIAPFGYGKTASAIGLWQACLSANLLAMPPISVESFTELARALYDWLLFVLPEESSRIQDAHDHFLASSAASLARRDERQFGIPFDLAQRAIQDKMERGYLDFENVTVNLIAFIEKATSLALKAGFRGLVLMIDEFQQLLGNASKGVLGAFRQLIWGLRTRQIAFGLLITMDPNTEQTLADRAGDILHRMKDDGMYVDIRHIYDQQFPTRLWNQYSTALNWPPEAQNSISILALQALGQLCERDDLSNGPRTVINVLQSVGVRAERNEPPYSPIDLIDDLLSGTVRFDGNKSMIPALVGEFLNYPYFQSSPQRGKLLKLIAAFPRGCSRETAQEYGVLEAWQEVGDDLRGDIITELDEGLALVQLQRVGRKVSRLNVLLRHYWMQITDEQLQAEDAPHVFSELVLPLLFPEKANDLLGWKAIKEIQLSATGAYSGLLEGTFSPRYPLRRLGISVVAGACSSLQLQAVLDDAQMSTDTLYLNTSFGFVFCLDFAAKQSEICASEAGGVVGPSRGMNRTFKFKLAIARPSEHKLRSTLAWIEHYLSPQPISPALVLSLLRYLKQSVFENLSERDQARRHDTIVRLQAWLLAELFPPELFRQVGYTVLAAGEQAFKELLYFASHDAWPTYSTLATAQHWAIYFDDYLAALKQINPAARIGMEPVKGTKSEIALLFGLQRHAGFESRAKTYEDLLNLEQWEGSSAVIYFVPHPAEEQLALQIREAGSLSKAEVYQSLQIIGFSSAEAKYLLDFACARGMIKQADDRFTMPDMPTVAELLARARVLQARCECFADGLQDIRERLNVILAHPEQLTELLRINWQFDDYEKRITEAEIKAKAKARTQRKAVRDQLLKVVPKLSNALSVVELHDLSAHLRAIHQRFTDEQQTLKDQAQKRLAEAALPSDETSGAMNVSTGHHIETLIKQIEGWSHKQALFERWNTFAKRLTLLPTTSRRLIEEARAILSQQGISALNEISHLEISLSDLEQEFKSTEKKQIKTKQVYSNVALLPTRKDLVQRLLALPTEKTSLSELLNHYNGPHEQADILSSLMQLQEEGAISITIEVLDMENCAH